MYWLLTENYVLNANILVFMLIHTELFSNVSALGLGLEKNFGPRPRPLSFWPRPRPWPYAQLASLTSLVLSLYCVIHSNFRHITLVRCCGRAPAVDGVGGLFLADERLATLSVTLTQLSSLHARHAAARLYITHTHTHTHTHRLSSSDVNEASWA